MEHLNFERREAIHPQWRGFLKLSNIDSLLEHESHRSRGTYSISNRVLTANWEKFKPDIFLEISGVYVHENLLTQYPRIERISTVTVGNKLITAKRVHVVVPGSDYEVSLRLETTDVPTFGHVFVEAGYESPNLPDAADVIVDLGANIGLATVFFGLRYPDADILSVEPENHNFIAMINNTAALGARVQKQHAAAWTKDGFINLHTENEDGAPLGAWGVQVSDRQNASGRELTRSYKIGTLLDKAGFSKVDVLKIDIEGAELEIFSRGAEEWLPRVNLIIIETHDRFRPGSEAAVRGAIGSKFEELPRSGENLFFRRVTT